MFDESERTRKIMKTREVGPGDVGHSSALPVAVIGAGPIGLAAAAHLVTRGETPLVLEAGNAVGASVREWAHVRLFSPWKYLIDPASRRMLDATGWRAPDADRLPTGDELIQLLLEPLAALPAIAPHLRLGHRVLAVTRQGMDKVKTAGRDGAPFELVVQGSGGDISGLPARAVIDASGTWQFPNPLGAGGVPAAGEAEHVSRISYGISPTCSGESAPGTPAGAPSWSGAATPPLPRCSISSP